MSGSDVRNKFGQYECTIILITYIHTHNGISKPNSIKVYLSMCQTAFTDFRSTDWLMSLFKTFNFAEMTVVLPDPPQQFLPLWRAYMSAEPIMF